MNFTDLFPLLTQVPLVGIFIWFVLEQEKRATVSRENRDKEWREFLQKQGSDHILAIQSLLISMERGDEKLYQSISQVTSQVTTLAVILTAHDSRAQEFMRGQKHEI